MSDKFDWNLNPDSPDLQRYLNMDLNEAAGVGDQEPAGAAAPAEIVNQAEPAAPAEPTNQAEPANPAEPENPAGNNNEQPNRGDQILDPADPAEPANPAGNNNEQPNPGDQILDPADPAAEDPEFYMNSGMEGNSLPNDDIWKKFDLCEGLTNRGPVDLLSDSYDDMPWLNHMAQPLRNDAREIRNHDCMWAGHCISEKHDINNPNNSNRSNYFPLTPPSVPRSDDTELMALTTPDGPAFADRPATRRNVVVAPTHARSVLLPSRVVSSTNTSRRSASVRSHTVTTSFRMQRSRTVDSGGDSPRPETPQSLTDNEDLNLDLADMKAVEDLVADSFGYSFISDIVQNIGNEASGYDFGANQFDRNQQGSTSNASGSAAPPRSSANRLKRSLPREEVPVSRHYTDHSFFSDHSYHLSKTARMDNLGVQTPSDSGARRRVSTEPRWVPASANVAPCEESSSEEEIDVETVYGELKKPNSRSSSSGSGLPTNPSFSDRQQIQLSVATAISQKQARRQNQRGGGSARGRNNATRGRNSAAARASNIGAARASTSAAARAGNISASRASSSAPNQASTSGTSQAGSSTAGDRGSSTRNTTGVKRKYNGRGEGRRSAGAGPSSEPTDGEEAHNRGGKRRRLPNDNPTRAGRSRTRRTGRNSGRSPGSSDSEVDSVERRSIHNSMERQRRIDLRNSFEELRKLIPKTAANEKAAKVLILSSGADYCKALTIEDLDLAEKKVELRRKQELLLARVSQLRRSLAARR